MISVTILVKNGERKLQEVLESLKYFDDILLFDTGSTDKTLEIASQFPSVKVHCHPFSGFGPSHNQAAALAKHDWILSIDADEVLSTPLANEILSLRLDPSKVYSFPFHNFFNGRHIRWCGWHPDRHIRLYNRSKTCFTEALVHEGIILDHVQEVPLKHPIYHYSYGSISDFLIKMERYSTLFASQNVGKRKSSPWIAIGHGLAAFFKSYVLKQGIFGGYEGFLISIYNGHVAFYKYLKLFHANASNLNVPSDRKR